MSLASIIRDSDGAIFNNAAQVFNHAFYWNSLSSTKLTPSGKLLLKIDDDFGSLNALKKSLLRLE
ncbi:hypothetical protein [Sulfurimonas sp.]|uniref:hypothetical protein n=1 Tax=Sulfurimonas sp. TaxID=2022749 RepID=UPI0025D4090E|nr:hypothetical protein [Sulfurimonas sp.]